MLLVYDHYQGYWQISLDAVSVGSKRPVTGTTSVIDSGTTLIVGDVFGVADFYAAIPGSAAFSSGFYTCEESDLGLFNASHRRTDHGPD